MLRCAQLILLCLLFPASASAAATIPACRLDDTQRGVVADALKRALTAYKELGTALPIDDVHVNSQPLPERTKNLVVRIVRDAAKAGVDQQGCPTTPVTPDTELDTLSVRGGCVVVALTQLEIRCSASSLKIFADVGSRRERANPALLYVLAHELGHILARRLGEYAGRADRIDLAAPPSAKIAALREACDPVSTQREEDADALAIKVLAKLLAAPPYRETVFTEQGSLYWNIDQLVLATNAWQQLALGREFQSQPKFHPAFTPTEFPTAPEVVTKKARSFVCDVITKRKGTLLYPGKSTSHPPLEQRLRRIAEALRPIAASLPRSGGQSDFAPIAKLQQDLGPILTHIYRETGVYMEALQANICSIINATTPEAICR